MKKLYQSLYNLSSAGQLKQAAAIVFIFLMGAILSGKLLGQAPTVSYAGPHTFVVNVPGSLTPSSSNVDASTGAYNSGVMLGSGLTFSQNGVAVDAAGNMYVCDMASTGEVKKITPDGSSTTIIGSGFLTQSSNVAVDQAGNVFVVDQATVWKIPASGSPVTYGTPVVINNTFREPFGLAVDGSGNIYVSDVSAGGVYKMANNGSGKTRIDNGLTQISAVALDAAGNVYAVSIGDFDLYEIPVNGGPQVQLAAGFNFPRGLAVDAAGTVYVDDEGNSGIFAVPAGGGTKVAVVSGLSRLVGVAVDAGYNLYGALQGNGGVTKYSPTGGFFISPVLPAGLSFDNTTGIIGGSATVASAATNYLVSAYNATGGTSATVNIATANAVVLSYSTPQTYTAGTAITALDPSVTSGTVAVPGYSTTPASIGSGFNTPSAVAVDAAGNVYVADAGNAAVEKLPAGGGSPVSIGSGFSYPTGVAVDAGGNVFVADQGNSSVFEIPVSGPQVTLGSGFVNPAAVAVDQSGNVYVIDESNETLYKIPAGTGTPVVLGAGFTELTAVAVDQSGNLYVVDGGASIVFEVSEKGGIPQSVGGSFLFPTGVAVDAAGIVYVTDFDAGKIYKLSACGCTEVAIGSGLNQAGGLAIDGAGNIYVADSGDNLVDEISPVGGYFVNTPLPAGLSLDGTSGEISGKPKKVSAAANYTITGWNVNNPGSATVNIAVVAPPPPAISYATPVTFTAGAAITPLDPSNIGGAVAFPAYSDTPVNIGSGFSQPSGIAIDASGNVYIADANNSAVEEIPFGSTTPISIGSGFDYPTGVAVDAAGDVFVADQGNSSVFEIPAGGGTQVTLGSGFSAPDGVAVDASGNVYVTDEINQNVSEIPAGNGTPIVIASGFFLDLTAIAIDGAGNLYIVDGGQGVVFELPKTGGLPFPLNGLFIYPTAVSVDAVGNVYVADGDAGAVFKILKNGFAQIPIANGFNEPGGVAVDGAGNVYVGDTNDNAVDEINPAGGYFINTALPQGLNLDGKTGIICGTATGGSPATNYTITGYNAGGSSAAVVNITVVIPPAPLISYTTPQAYQQGIAITPLLPSSTNVDLSSYSSTFGAVGSGFSFPYGVAIDNQGDIFIADAGNAAVWELPAGGGPQISVVSGFTGPTGVAVDAGGNVYVADAGASAVVEVPAAGGPQVPLGSGYNYPDAIAVDAAGNVYIADAGTRKVYKIAHGHTSRLFFASGFNYPTGVAVDNSGNVFIADEGSGGPSVLYEVAAGSSTPTPLPYNFNLLTGIATDASGNLYAADSGLGQIIEFPSGSNTAVKIGGLGWPNGMDVDLAGNLYTADIGTNLVNKIQPTGGYYISAVLPSGLSFNSTTGAITGTPTIVSPAKNYTITAYNVSGSGSAAVSIKVASTDATLASLSLSSGTLSPAFSPGGAGYTANVPYSVSSITVTATPNDPNASSVTTMVNGSPASGSTPLNVGSNTVVVTVTPQDGITTDSYTVTINRAASVNANLARLTLTRGVTVPAFTPSTMAYTVTVTGDVTTETITPTASDLNATITLNGSPIASGTTSDPFTLTAGDNSFILVVTAQNHTTKTYTLTITQVLSSDAYLSNLALRDDDKVNADIVALSPGFTFRNMTYTATVPSSQTSVTVKPTSIDPNAVVTVDNAIVATKTFSNPIMLHTGSNTISILVTAQDGTQKTYTVTITRLPSSDAYLSNLVINTAALSPAFTYNAFGYTASVPNETASVTIKANVIQADATFTINGHPGQPQIASDPIQLAVGTTTIPIVVTAQDNHTTKTYTIVITRAAGGIDSYLPGISVTKPTKTPVLAEDGIKVHQGISPNGDGIEDFLQIDNISQYPDNKLAIMNRNGQLVYEAKGYDNSSKLFDGHSNKNGQMQLPGTYFYQLDYTVSGITRHKTGFIVLKY